ncbi:MAG: hypothetical protein LBK73_13645 [Treponema sp.]|jgi:hypothetical protein|nr:hypothetical protein [Treponema sp.]
MKRKLFFTGTLCLAVAFGLALVIAGCDSGGGEPTKYTVTFDLNGGTLTSGLRVQEVEEKKYAAIPGVTPPAGKEADGWTSSVASLSSPDSPITADVTFTAKWKNKGNSDTDTADTTNNPLANTAWSDSYGNYAEYLIFTPSVAYSLLVTKESSINTTDTEITLGNENSLSSSKTYKYELTGGKLIIKNSYVTDSKGDPSDLPLTRMEGSTKTGVYDVWYSSSLTSNDTKYTVLIIRTNGDVWAAIGGKVDVNRWPYEVKDINAPKPFIKWTNESSSSTDFLLENNNLTMKYWYDYYYDEYLDVTFTKTTL